jgi:predicted TIM-barrel fold metal-dependent hydrolase
MSQTSSSGIAAPTIAGPVPDTRKPRLKLPAGSCDTHAHIVGPQDKFPYDPDRRYTPPDALVPDYLKMLRTLGVERAVIVQPSVYMTDNTRLLAALRESTDFPLRGIAVVNDRVTDEELRVMHEAGVRGLRVNLRVKNGASGDMAPQLARRIAPTGWHLQVRVDPKDFASARSLIETLPVDVVIDHIGGVPAGKGLDGEEFRMLLDLVSSGRCWVKLSAPMRMSEQEFPYSDVTPFVRALVAAAPDRMVWATDWPHTGITKRMPNDGDLCDLLSDWLPDPAVLKKVLVDNPARLYGF